MIIPLAPCINGTIELVGSFASRAGVVHVCINETWGTVCGGEKNQHFASVVCSQLGYSSHGTYTIITIQQHCYTT